MDRERLASILASIGETDGEIVGRDLAFLFGGAAAAQARFEDEAALPYRGVAVVGEESIAVTIAR